MLAAMPTARASAALFAVLVTLPAARALAWPTLEPEGPRTSLLGGRWTIALGPDVSAAAAMGDPRVPTRAELDGIATMRTDDGRLSVRATLLSATRPADLEAVVRALPAPCTTSAIGPLADHEGVVSIACTEPSPDGAFRPLVLYATHTDGWVDRIEVQLDIDEASDRALALAFATAVAASLRAEAAAPAVERGTVEIARACVAGEAADRFTVTLPEGWIATRLGDEELTVLQFVRVGEVGARRPIASISFASGAMPPARIPAGAGTPREGTLLGSSVEWLEVSGPPDQPGLRETALELSVACGGDGPAWTGTIQLSVGGPAGMLDEGARVLETLALSSDRGHTVSTTGLGTEEEAPPPETSEAGATDEEDAEMQRTSHLWSMGIAGASLALLAIALVLRSRTTRPK